jgi:hypothetical protein
MLCRNGYPAAYIADARRLVDADLAATDALTATADPAAVDAFTPHHLASVVLVLEQLFVHRTRGMEGKDGNPCNEVRQLARAIMEEDGVVPADKQIKLDPSRTVTGLGPGDAVVLTRDSVGRLVDAYFAEIETRFTAPEAVTA